MIVAERFPLHAVDQEPRETMPTKSGALEKVVGNLCLSVFALTLCACAPKAAVTPAIVDELNIPALSASVDNGDYGRIAAIVVSRNGRIVFEDYFGRQTADDLVDMRSVGKSLTALAAGVAINEGAVSSLDAPVLPTFADNVQIDEDDPVRNGIVLRDLLTMRTPLDCNDWEDSPGNEERMYRTRNWTQFALNIPVDQAFSSDTVTAWPFRYCTAGVFLTGQMLQRQTGIRFDQYVENRILEPLGVSNVQWRRSPTGEVQSGGQLRMRALDAERIGRLVLNEGAWDGQQIIPQPWIREMLTPVSSPGAGLAYGYLWWLTEFQTRRNFEVFPSALMIGNGGNLVAVVPSLDAVIVIQAQNYNVPHDFEISRTLIQRYILPALVDQF
jgi:CubicO group peptidase (beta-lactamase class C family)